MQIVLPSSRSPTSGVSPSARIRLVAFRRPEYKEAFDWQPLATFTTSRDISNNLCAISTDSVFSPSLADTALASYSQYIQQGFDV